MGTFKRIPLAALVIGQAAMAISLVWAARVLPAEVASHFNAAGAADAWMSREAHVVLMGLVGLGLPLFLVGVFYGVRWLPAGVVNIPHREYWLAPERRAQTLAAIWRLGLWMAVLLSVHVLVIHVLVVEANLNNPPRLAGWAWGAVALFLAGTALWVAALWRRFGGRKALEDKRQVAAQEARE